MGFRVASYLWKLAHLLRANDCKQRLGALKYEVTLMGVYIMKPDWHDDIRVPSSVGDDVRISHMITVDASSERAKSFQISVQPQMHNGTLSSHASSLSTLLLSTHRKTTLFLDRYLQSNINAVELDELRVELKNILENHRSALDYTAHYIAERCTPKPSSSKVQFPVASPKDTLTKFSLKLDKWFPDLISSAPKVRDYLLCIQEFNGELWLRQLADLTNFNKHRSLSSQKLDIFNSVVVRFDDSGIRLGELGLLSLTIEAGGVLRFVNSSGQHVDLDVPCVIDANTISIPGADPRIEVVAEKHKLYCIPGTKKSIASTVWSIDKNVFRAVDQICSLLS